MKRRLTALAAMLLGLGLLQARPRPARMVLLTPPGLEVLPLLDDPGLGARWAAQLQSQGAAPSLLEACHALRPGAQELGSGLWEFRLSGLPPQQARQALAALGDCLLPATPGPSPLEGAEQQQSLEEREDELIESLWSRAQREQLIGARRLELLGTHSERYLQSYLENLGGLWRQELLLLRARQEPFILVVPPEVAP